MFATIRDNSREASVPEMSDPIQGFNLITSLQAETAKRLKAIDQFTGREGLEILTEDIGDVLAALNQRLSKVGIGLAVLTPKIAKGERTGEIVVTIVIAIAENTIKNRSSTGSNVRASDLAAASTGLLDGWQTGPWTRFILQGAEPVAPPPAEAGAAFKEAVEWDVTFQTNTIIRVEEIE